MDSPARSQDLADLILSSNAAAACSAVDSHLRNLVPDQTRSFFSLVFPDILRKLFGFHDASPAGGWIAAAAADPALAGKLVDLLSPSGILLSTISGADRHSLVKYVFPAERLPAYMKFLMQNKNDNLGVLEDLCVLFRGRLKKDPIHGVYLLQLNIFEFYMFWFAYYPVCKGICGVVHGHVERKSRRFRFENWTSSLPALVAATSSSSSRSLGEKQECDVYMRLLGDYLCEFVSNPGLSGCGPYRGSMLRYNVGGDDSVWLREEFFVHTLVQFWLVDNDFSPVAANVRGSLGVLFPFRGAFAEAPPTAGLGKAVQLVVNYLNSSSNDDKMVPNVVEYSGGARKIGGIVSSPFCSGRTAGPLNLMIQRPLYRFILRTFLFCPVGATMKNVSEVFSVWINYIEPWKACLEKCSDSKDLHNQPSRKPMQSYELSRARGAGITMGSRSEAVYSSLWQRYVLSNYMFYSPLVVHFLGFCHKFITSHPETIIKMVLKLLTILTSSSELVEFLQKVDAVYHSQPTEASTPLFDDTSKFVPYIRSQLQDWEEGLSENEAEGSFLHENWNNDLKLFSGGEDGGHQLIQLLILRAEGETKAISGDNITDFLKAVNSVKTQKSTLFGHLSTEKFSSTKGDVMQGQHGQKEFTPKLPGFGKRTWAEIKYKGDWMRRPISESEVAWLARLLVQISDWLNQILGLDRQGGETDQAGREHTWVEAPKDEVVRVNGLWQATWMLVSGIVSCVLVSVQFVLRYARQQGWRFNLRQLASKKIVTLMFVFIVLTALKRAFGLPGSFSFPAGALM